MSYSLNFWIASWNTKDSASNDSKHSLTSIRSFYIYIYITAKMYFSCIWGFLCFDTNLCEYSF